MLATMVALSFFTVFYRYVLESSLSWSYEVLLGLLVYLTFFSGYVALRQGAHLKIDVLVRRLRLRGQVVVFAVNQLLIIGVCTVMVIWGAEQTISNSGRTSAMLGIPMSAFYWVVPVAGAAMILECLAQFARVLRGATRGERPYPDEQHEEQSL